MKFLNQFKIKYKIIFIILVAAIPAVVAITSFLIIDTIHSHKENMRENTELITQLVGRNLIGILSLGDLKGMYKEDAKEIVEKVDLVSYISDIVLYDTDSSVFLTYHKNKKSPFRVMPLSSVQEGFKGNKLNILYDIRFKSVYLGTLFVQATTEELEKKITDNVKNILLTAILIIMLAVLFSLRTQRWISAPILELARKTKSFSEDDDYRMELIKETDDEVGTLYDAFNHMFGQLNYRKTERDRVQKELEEAKIFLKNIIDSMPSILIVVDSDGKMTHWNQAALDVITLDEEVLKGMEFWKVSAYFSRLKQYYFELLNSGDPIEVHKVRIQENPEVYVNISVFSLFGDNKKGIVIRIDDVTDLEKIDAQLRQAQKMETIGTLAGGFAHDFNNLLSGMTGTLSLIAYKQEKEIKISRDKMNQYIQTLEYATNRAGEMVQQLLTLSRKQELNLKQVNLNEVLNNVIKICVNSFDKSVEIQSALYSRKAYVYADQTLVEQVILNIMINANHAMTFMKKEDQKQGGILNINVDMIKADRFFQSNHPEAKWNEDYWIISIRDTGVGMDRKTISKIFDPFYTTKEKEHGTGLGLAMAYNIIQQHKGFIDVYSEENIGSTFNIYLPIYKGETYEENNSLNDLDVLRGEGTVLVVDDEFVVRDVAASILEECGYHVVLAKDGVEGVEIYKEKMKDIDLVILDMIMPRKNGKETFMELRKINPNLKILISSGFKQDSRIRDTIRLGARYFIQKPYSLKKLAAIVYEIMNL